MINWIFRKFAEIQLIYESYLSRSIKELLENEKKIAILERDIKSIRKTGKKFE